MKNVIRIGLLSLLVGCGNQGNNASSMLGADGRCIVSTAIPFGNVAALTDEQKKQVFALADQANKVSRQRAAADLVILSNTVPGGTDLAARLKQEVQSGVCSASGSALSSTRSVDGAACSVSYRLEKQMSAQQRGRDGRIQGKYQILLRNEIDFAGKLKSVNATVDVQTVYNSGLSTSVSCINEHKQFQTTDGTTIETALSEELLASTTSSQITFKRIYKLPTFVAQIECKGPLSKPEKCTLNGVQLSDMEAFTAQLAMSSQDPMF